MTITDQQARAVAFLLNQLRPDWGAGSLLTLIGKHPDVELGPLIVAATTKALEASCATPGPIFVPGPHWPVKARAKLPRPEPCPDHIGEAAHNCRCCNADIKAGIRPETHIGKHWQPHTIADALEASAPPEHGAAADVAAFLMPKEGA